MTPPLFVPALGRSLYPGASVALDFTRNLYRSGTPVVKGSPSLLSGWTFTRASTGYAETAAGALVAFASGEIRRTDKGLLVEEARTNLCLYNGLTGGTLFPTGWTAGSNNGSARGPVASTTGAVGAWEQTALNQREYFTQTITLAANSTYTVSVYVEAVTGTTRTLSYCASLPAGATTGSIFNPSTPGLYTYQVVTAGTAGTCVLRLGIDTSGDLNANATVRFSRVQFELGAFATSYIPTTTASATRAADVATMAYAPTFPVTMVCNLKRAGGLAAVRTFMMLDDGTANERAILRINASNNVETRQTTGGVDVATVTTATALSALNTQYKIAGRFALNDVNAAASGTAGTADASAAVPVGPTVLRLGHLLGGTEAVNAYIERAIIYPVLDADAALAARTA